MKNKDYLLGVVVAFVLSKAAQIAYNSGWARGIYFSPLLLLGIILFAVAIYILEKI